MPQVQTILARLIIFFELLDSATYKMTAAAAARPMNTVDLLLLIESMS
jgi:hypothetical protein